MINDKILRQVEKDIAAAKQAVEFTNVSYGYTKERLALEDVSFSINEGEYVCIIGHNGSGKSTISKVLTGLLRPSKGHIKLFGERISLANLKFLRNNIGIVFQNPDNQFIGMTAEDDIAFGLENRKVPREMMWSIILKAAEAVDITQLLKKESSELSGGQKQRVAIASILAINPKVIIFDESTSMLDPKGKTELKELMVKLRDEAMKTVISITHDMEEVIKADKVIVMDQGRVIRFGTPAKVFENEAFLQEIKLDVPFTLKLSRLLKEKSNKKINLTLDHKELIKQICH